MPIYNDGLRLIFLFVFNLDFCTLLHYDFFGAPVFFINIFILYLSLSFECIPFFDSVQVTIASSIVILTPMYLEQTLFSSKDQ